MVSFHVLKEREEGGKVNVGRRDMYLVVIPVHEIWYAKVLRYLNL